MNRSDFLSESDTRLEIVFLDFVIQHRVDSDRISQVPCVYCIRMPCSRTPDGLSKLLWSGVAFTSSILARPITSQLFLEALSLKGDVPPNGLRTLCLHFTDFVTWSAQDSIFGSVENDERFLKTTKTRLRVS